MKNSDVNCCPEPSVVERNPPVNESSCNGDDVWESVTKPCVKCQRKGWPVSRKTVLLMLKPNLLDQAMHGNYRFCSVPDCPIVYFEDEGKQQFTIDDLRVRVGLKVIEDPVPLCYCFGFDESHIRDDLFRTGTTTIPQRISQLIREGLCACESRNPSGMCCLGEVNRTHSLLKGTGTK